MVKKGNLETIRHSLAHLMAASIQEFYPEAKFGIGPVIQDGFYYDVYLEESITPEDLEKIERSMRRKVSEKLVFERTEMPIGDAIERFRVMSQDFKVELLNDLKSRGTTAVMDIEDDKLVGENIDTVSLYKTGEFLDLCRGPHINNTGEVQPDAFKLTRVSGAYWRGDQANTQLQRVYGVAFENKKELKAYFLRVEEAKKRDHRKLGVELDLFSVDPETIGGGLVLWHPKGGLVRHLAEDYCKREHLSNGYDFVYTPHVGRATLWETSGHLDFYADGMYAPLDIDEQEFYLKPMNCPFHVNIFKTRIRSYRDLPIRLAEWGTVYRYERSGVLHGLTRARGFTQDDAHLFCRPDQMPAEIDKVLDFSLHILRSFGFDDFKLYLSTRPEKRVGEDSDWAAAESALEASLDRSGLPFQVNAGDGAFYGPKIDIALTDAIGRPWQLSTIQFDFNLPERFDLNFVGEDGAQHRPYMIHRALLGSMERFFGILIEHYAGAFPVWLAPIQAVVIPIADRHLTFCEAVVESLNKEGLRVELDSSAERMNAKIRNAQVQKIPYMLVVGDKEVEAQSIALRLRTGEDLKRKTLDEFIAIAREAIASKS